MFSGKGLRVTAVLAGLTLGVIATGCPEGDSRAIASPAPASLAEGAALTQAVLDQVRVEGSPARVRYGALAADRSRLDKALAYFAAVDPQHLKGGWEGLPFWINVYNMSMLDSVLAHWGGRADYSVSEKSFAVFHEPTHTVAGTQLSLNEIEHGIIRGDLSKVRPEVRAFVAPLAAAAAPPRREMGRVHMALNCASVGCPELAARAYLPRDLDSALSAQAATYLKDPARGAGPKGISELFKWYTEDFATQAAGEAAPVKGVKPFIQAHRGDVEGVNMDAYIPYDWSLNVAKE